MRSRGAGLILQGISFEEQVVMVQFLDPDDVKGNGAQRHQQLYIPRGDDYDDEIEAVEDAVKYLIADINEDWSNLKSADELKKKYRRDVEDED